MFNDMYHQGRMKMMMCSYSLKQTFSYSSELDAPSYGPHDERSIKMFLFFLNWFWWRSTPILIEGGISSTDDTIIKNLRLGYYNKLSYYNRERKKLLWKMIVPLTLNIKQDFHLNISISAYR